MRHNILARTNVFDASEKEARTNASSGRNNFNKSNNSSTKPLTTFTTSSPHTTKYSLHSKSTYFYQWFSGNNKKSNDRKEDKGRSSIKKSSSSLYSTSSTSFSSLTHSSLFSYSIPIACSIALLGGLGMAIFPVASNGTSGVAHAEEGLETYAAGDSLKLGLTGTNPDNTGSTELSVTDTVYRPYSFNVTAPAGGYKIYVQAASGYTGELRGLANPREVISGVGSNISGNAFPANTWGYHLEAGNPAETAYGGYLYSSVPNNGDSVRAAEVGENAAVTDKAYTVIFGARVGDDKPADHYQTKVLLSLTSSANETASLSTVGTMQEVTASVCDNTPIEPNTGYTARLKDTRDGKYYWVARLKDGNCWMTQNLDYDGGGSKTTDVSQWGNDDNKAQYFDPGFYVYTTPTEINNCGVVSSLADCTSKNWAKVGAGTSYLTAGTNSNMASVLSGSTYDAHYHIGNYYSWAAATARTGEYLWEDGAEAPGSICPKGWSLPLSGDSTGSNNNKSGSFRNLLNKYGFSFGDNGVSESLTGTVGGTTYNIAGAPLHFLRGGGVVAWTNPNSLTDAGIAGHYWSRIVLSGTNAYYLDFYNTTVNPSNSISRYYGFSIRCLVI